MLASRPESVLQKSVVGADTASPRLCPSHSFASLCAVSSSSWLETAVTIRGQLSGPGPQDADMHAPRGCCNKWPRMQRCTATRIEPPALLEVRSPQVEMSCQVPPSFCSSQQNPSLPCCSSPRLLSPLGHSPFLLLPGQPATSSDLTSSHKVPVLTRSHQINQDYIQVQDP